MADSRTTPRVEEASLELVVGGRSVPLGFVGDGPTVYLVARDRSARWPVDVLRAGRASLRRAGGAVVGSATLIVDPAVREAVLERFRTKYGSAGYARWYQHPARILRIDLVGAADDGPEGARYYGWLAEEFDNVADDYDRHILGNRMNRLLRDRSLAHLRATFGRARRLLEVGCGSGMETLPLLADGHEIVCVDISERMLEVVRTKARREGLLERLRTVRSPAGELARLVPELGVGGFDGAYSTYGAMNCEPDLAPVAAALHEALPTGARFVAGVYNRWCLFELVGYGLTGAFSRAFGRAADPVRVGASRFCVDVYAYSPATFARAFAPGFRPLSWQAVPVVLPPSDLTGYAEKFGSHFEQLAAWDRSLAARWPLRSLGDHFLMTLERTPYAVR